MTNDFPYEAEQLQTWFASLNELSPQFRIVLRSEAMNSSLMLLQSHTLLCSAKAIFFLQLGMPRTRIYVHFDGPVAACSTVSI